MHASPTVLNTRIEQKLILSSDLSHLMYRHGQMNVVITSF